MEHHEILTGIEMDIEPYPDEMFEEAERREKKNEVLKIAKNPDEFVFGNVRMVHYEVMNENSVWIGIYLNNDRLYHLNIHGDNLRVYLTDETTQK